MKRNTNVFVLTTEYHFLLTMNIIRARYSASEYRNILVFTGERLSGVVIANLPSNVETLEINVEDEKELKHTIDKSILQQSLGNLFVFTAYRDLETYLLTTVHKTVERHLVQDGANFYFKILKLVMLGRLKETVKIYSNLWRKGIFFKRLVRYKKHMAQCSFIDYVWLTNPAIYQQPRFSTKPIIELDLLTNRQSIAECSSYFAFDTRQQYNNAIIYLSSRLTKEEDVMSEISLIRSIATKLNNYKLLIKLHPNAPTIQFNLFNDAFAGCVVKNFVPAELYIANATDSYIIGGVTAALYYNNPKCIYLSLIKIYQQLGLFPDWIEVKFPAHVKVMDNLNELNLISTSVNA